MYFLSQRDTRDFSLELHRTLNERRGYMGDPQDSSVFGKDLDPEVFLELKDRDPGYDPQFALPDLTVSMLRELHGEKLGSLSGRFGSHDPYGKGVNLTDSRWAAPKVKLHAARAMVLAAQPVALLDPIAARLTDETLTRHSEGKRYCISVPTNAGVFSWREMVELGPLKQHFLPGGERTSLSGVERLDIEPTVRLSKEPRQQLRLRFDGKVGGIIWEARGSSKLKRSHLKLVTELNAVLQDYQNRQQWADDYRKAPSLKGYERKQVESIRRELMFYTGSHRKLLDLSYLSPGVSFGDDPLTLRDRWRCYYDRCVGCGRVVTMDFIVAKSAKRQPWDSLESDAFYQHYGSDIKINPMLREFHTQNGCSSTEVLGWKANSALSIGEK